MLLRNECGNGILIGLVMTLYKRTDAVWTRWTVGVRGVTFRGERRGRHLSPRRQWRPRFHRCCVAAVGNANDFRRLIELLSTRLLLHSFPLSALSNFWVDSMTSSYHRLVDFEISFVSSLLLSRANQMRPCLKLPLDYIGDWLPTRLNMLFPMIYGKHVESETSFPKENKRYLWSMLKKKKKKKSEKMLLWLAFQLEGVSVSSFSWFCGWRWQPAANAASASSAAAAAAAAAVAVPRSHRTQRFGLFHRGPMAAVSSSSGHVFFFFFSSSASSSSSSSAPRDPFYYSAWLSSAILWHALGATKSCFKAFPRKKKKSWQEVELLRQTGKTGFFIVGWAKVDGCVCVCM